MRDEKEDAGVRALLERGMRSFSLGWLFGERLGKEGGVCARGEWWV